MKEPSLPKRFMQTLAICGLLWAAAWFWPVAESGASTVSKTVTLQLAAWKGQASIPLEIQGDWRVTNQQGNEILTGSHFKGRLSLDSAGANLGAWALPLSSFAIRPRGNHALRIGDRWYDGVLQVVLQSDQKTRLPSAFDLRLEIPLEDYVVGVLCGEMATSTSGTAEALQAQAIASRTYALWRLSKGRDFLRDDTTDQRYLGSDYHTKAAQNAVHATRDIVLTWQGDLLPAYFHADCAGHTVDAFDVDFVRKATPPLAGVPDPNCATRGQWSNHISASALDAIAANRGVGEWVQRVEAARRDGVGRWMQARITGNQGMLVLNADHLRTSFGTPSACWTEAEVMADGSFELRGRGYGHGVGMCQRGARDRARSGQSHIEILAHYYPGAAIESWLGLSQAR